MQGIELPPVPTVRAPPSVGGDGGPWHTRPAEEAVRALGVDAARGLSSVEAERRLATTGPNELLSGPHRGPARILAAQFTDVMVLVLIAAALLAAVIGEPQDAVAIGAILMLNATLGFVQEYQAERAVAALLLIAAPQARARRDGEWDTLAARELVPGDIVRIEAGDSVPADLRLLEAVQLRVAEAALTGESVPVDKSIAPTAAATPLAERIGMAFAGTTVAQGRGTGIVVATGSATELGHVATLLARTEPVRTPLQRRLARFTQRIAIVVIAICALLFVLGLLRGEAPGLMLLTAISLAVAAIPEALPAVVTMSLALGARRAATQRALIRRLPAVETLGSVTYICSDKTGTLTENRMRVTAIRMADALGVDAAAIPAGADLLLAMALCNDADRARDGAMRGDPTEVALHEAAEARGARKSDLTRALPRLGEFPFTPARGLMTTVHRRDGRLLALTKGAPERVIERCGRALGSGRVVPLDRTAVLTAAAQLASQGQRVLAVAVREFAAESLSSEAEAVERDLTFLGLVGLLDPPRAEARAAVAECHAAGIHVVMVTGDHPETARAIASQVGITGAVHARVSPEEKLRLVEELQARGEYVAMTGDGVNDAPALKRADIGIAMGRSGTDVAREAADMILLDDHFATIVGAVREGRRIYDNIRKFVRYALTCNSAEIWALVLAPLIGLPIPLLPIHILWINLVTDGLPGLALSVEPAEPMVMRRPPRPPSESIFAHGLWQHAVWVGLVMGGTTLSMQAWAWSSGHAAWQTMTFTVLAFLQLGHLLAIRSDREPFHRRFFANRSLLGAVMLTTVLQVIVIYVPWFNNVLGTVPLSPSQLALCLAVSSTGFIAVELEKAIRRRTTWRPAPIAAI